MLEHAPHGRKVVERGKRRCELDWKPGKSRHARDAAEHDARGVGADFDRTPPERIGIAGVVRASRSSTSSSVMPCSTLDVVEHVDQVVDVDRLGVERDDDMGEYRIDLRPLHTFDRVQGTLERVDQWLRARAGARPAPRCAHAPQSPTRDDHAVVDAVSRTAPDTADTVPRTGSKGDHTTRPANPDVAS